MRRFANTQVKLESIQNFIFAPVLAMTLTKKDIVKSVASRVAVEKPGQKSQQSLFPHLIQRPISHKRASKIVETLFEIIKSTLAKGEDVGISGFGKFKIAFKWARKGRNPHTGEEIIIPSHRRVTFKVSRKLKEKINRG